MSSKPHPPPMTPYANRRVRKYLYASEIERLLDCARENGRHGLRDATMLLFLFRHGLRGSEARALTWEQIDMNNRCIYIKRKKNGLNSTHALSRYEMGALQMMKKTGQTGATYVFITEFGLPLSHSTLYKIAARAGKQAKIGLPVNPHMLRHSCGFHLANVCKTDARRIQEYLGHRDINHTVAYTALDNHKFDDIWEEKNTYPFDHPLNWY